MRRIAVIGLGSWGTAFAGLVAANSDEVMCWAHSLEVADGVNTLHRSPRYLPGYELPANVRATTSVVDAAEGADAVVLAAPSTHLRAVAEGLVGTVSDDTPVLVLTKGIERDTGLTMSGLAADVLGNPGRVAALSGPNHAEEVCQGLPSAAVLAAPTTELACLLRDTVATPTFRVYVSLDTMGVEVCGAVKNVIAIACGAVAGIGGGDNTMALIMTRGVAEVGRMVSAMGGDPLTCMGLAGMGDLVATCTSRHSRNRRFGEVFVSGTTLEQFERETHMVVEGAHAADAVRQLARAHAVEVPITDAVWAVMHERAHVRDAVARLMDRLPTEEFYGMGERPVLSSKEKR